MLTKEMRRVFLGNDQLKPAVAKFCRAIEKLSEMREAGFVVEDLEGYIDPFEFEELIRWLAEIYNEDQGNNIAIKVLSSDKKGPFPPLTAG